MQYPWGGVNKPSSGSICGWKSNVVCQNSCCLLFFFFNYDYFFSYDAYIPLARIISLQKGSCWVRCWERQEISLSWSVFVRDFGAGMGENWAQGDPSMQQVTMGSGTTPGLGGGTQKDFLST